MMTTPFSPTSRRFLILLIFIVLLGSLLPGTAMAQSGPVQVVLFYSPFCGHCQRVIGEGLPPIVQAYNTSYSWSYFGDPPDEETGQLPPIVAFEGDLLQILYVDTTTQVGNELYMANVERLQIPPEDQVVPIMVVGEQLLIGDVQIPEQLPGLVDQWLAEGGLSWPDIPGLEQTVTALVPFPDQAQESPTPETGETQADPGAPGADPVDQVDPGPEFERDVSKLSVLERIQLDPLGNTLSIVVLIGMIFSLVFAGLRWRMGPTEKIVRLPHTAILVLLVAGIGVAGYLSFVETSGTEAVCGPVGDCNTVQSSEYAHLLGFLPVGILGLAGYIGMLLVWVFTRRSMEKPGPADLAIFGMSLLGTGFSSYLTFLEPFVIGATCMWCLSSAVIITAIMLLSVDRARVAFVSLRA